MFKFAAYVVALGLVASQTFPPWVVTVPEDMCAENKLCYSYPPGQDSDAEFVLSIRPNHTDILVRYTHVGKYVAIWTTIGKSKAMPEQFFTCWSGSAQCFFGHNVIDPETKNITSYVVDAKYTAITTIMSRSQGNFILSFPHVLFDTGYNVTYYYKTGEITANDPVNPYFGRPLFYLSGKKANYPPKIATIKKTGFKNVLDKDLDKAPIGGDETFLDVPL